VEIGTVIRTEYKKPCEMEAYPNQTPNNQKQDPVPGGGGKPVDAFEEDKSQGPWRPDSDLP
jgi:hypothetical protein